MPTYEYECTHSGKHFECHQSIGDAPLTLCPDCGGEVRRLISGGAGFIFKGTDQSRFRQDRSGCSLEQQGTTCCGREERCGAPPCGGRK